MNNLDSILNWPDLMQHPGCSDHIVQTYQDDAFLAEGVVKYVGAGLRLGQAAIVIATPAHRKLFQRGLEAEALYPSPAVTFLDAEETLAAFMVAGMPEWTSFHGTCGGAIAELRLQYPAVRAYGEMVDVLWQQGKRNAAVRLEEFWNELGKLQTFSLLCAYCMDPLDASAYGGALESVCKVHTHLVPTRDYARFNEAVDAASEEVLDQPLAQMLLSLSANHRPQTDMPHGQATLLWLKQNMPRTADRVLEGVRARLG